MEWGAYYSAGNMVPYAGEHDSGSKQLLNGYVAPAGLTPQQDLDSALDNIFNHPNVGPFVGTQLIQHLVKSNPSPAYVSRVAAAFTQQRDIEKKLLCLCRLSADKIHAIDHVGKHFRVRGPLNTARSPQGRLCGRARR